MPDHVPESAARAAREIKAVFSRLRRRLRDLALEEDLTPSQTAALIRLAKEGSASASQLAGAERVRPQSMATTLAALDRHGLIRREPDPDDGRRQLIMLTTEGRCRAESDRKLRDDWLVRALQERYTERERRVIVDALALLDRLTD
jgi:DNA-binding MarR family transcriptional regulator